eukprot:scaffold21778_cov131-Isochrysis_galbana.AAC.7
MWSRAHSEGERAEQTLRDQCSAAVVVAQRSVWREQRLQRSAGRAHAAPVVTRRPRDDSLQRADEASSHAVAPQRGARQLCERGICGHRGCSLGLSISCESAVRGPVLRGDARGCLRLFCSPNAPVNLRLLG